MRSFLKGNVEAGYQTFRTTSQNFYNYDTTPIVGEGNQGIVVYEDPSPPIRCSFTSVV